MKVIDVGSKNYWPLRFYLLDSNGYIHVLGWKISPKEAVKLATDIINHCYPFTRPNRYINQGCHRPGGH